MNATPENFKPGERWLAAMGLYTRPSPVEIVCLEWSRSGQYVKVKRVQSGTVNWEMKPFKLLERLPDESGNNQTGQARRVEAPCGKCAYCRWEIEQHRNELTEEEREAISKESVATQVEVEALRNNETR